MIKLVKHNTREHKELLRVLSHTSVIEKKTCMAIASAINKISDEEAEKYRAESKNYFLEIPIRELTETINSSYQALRAICKKITKHSIDMEIPYQLKNGKTEVFNSTEVIFIGAGISNNTFQIKINPDVLPLFSRTLNIYRHYDIIEAKYLTHKHSIEFYKFLKDKQNQNILDFTISIRNLKNELGLIDKYKQYNHFKTRVIEPAKNDMKKSVLWFDYKEIKRSRSVTDLIIYIYTNKEKEQDIHVCERINQYIKTTAMEIFKKDFLHFLKEAYCFSRLSKTIDYQELNIQEGILSQKRSLLEYNKELQKRFIEWLEPTLNLEKEEAIQEPKKSKTIKNKKYHKSHNKQVDHFTLKTETATEDPVPKTKKESTNEKSKKQTSFMGKLFGRN